MAGAEFTDGDGRPVSTESVEWISNPRRLRKGLDRYNQLFNDSSVPLRPLIKKLYGQLGEIFANREMHTWSADADSSVITHSVIADVRTRQTITASEVADLKSDGYRVSLLVDLSGSMHGEKIKETVRGVIVLANVLDMLGIQTEILGFNDRLFGYKRFDERMSDEVKARIGTMEDQTDLPGAETNDDGYCLEQASFRLAGQEAKVKALMVLSDGLPVPLSRHVYSHDLKDVIRRLSENKYTSDQKIIGLGLGIGTHHVTQYYPLNRANMFVEQMTDQLGEVLKVVIDIPDQLY